MLRREIKRTGCPTPLNEWLLVSGVSIGELARGCGVERNTVKAWKRGTALPSLVCAVLLQQVTKGGVPVASWMGTELARQELAVRKANGTKPHGEGARV